jgi:hypothetical protein
VKFHGKPLEQLIYLFKNEGQACKTAPGGGFQWEGEKLNKEGKGG